MNNQITIYGAEWCGFCHSMRQYFEKKNISFDYKDVEKDEADYNELMGKLGGQANYGGIPVTDIAGDIILGFDRTKVDAALAKHKITS
jgi:glutaredoxin 3